MTETYVEPAVLDLIDDWSQYEIDREERIRVYLDRLKLTAERLGEQLIALNLSIRETELAWLEGHND